ncbi:hypothetical protein [Brevundimonas sp.]|uniref:hypothetical protein n=1 Tax=Brevundimonas sp. TaxID=1871086 RepID=UPI0011FD14E8|nr:hypothetical protein [Brevundimonas sp.]TAJ63702.1 MAG: hypothetical protein EPO49_06710 [Brevundimonas sp.]
MPRIRTDAYAFVIAFAFAAAFMFGHLKLGMLDLPDWMRTYDRLLLWLAAGAGMYVALFGLGHLALRRIGAGERWAYAILGGLALVAMYLAFKGPTRLAVVFGSGEGVIGLIIPFLIGSAFGFLYAWRAGWEVAEEEDLDGLRARMAGVTGADERDLDAFQTGGHTYFAGPVRVRTSIPLMVLSAVIGGILHGLVRGAIRVSWEVMQLPDPTGAEALAHAGNMSQYAGFEMVAMAIIGAPPIALAILVGHYAARGLKQTDAWAYLGLGLVAPLVISLLALHLFWMVAIMIMIPTAVAMAIYRSFAGLEPVPVREDVQARRNRDLVGADHPRRRFARVVRGR